MSGDSFSLPSGYGFARLTLEQLRARSGPEDLLDHLVIWERPRTRGPRRYIMGADPADGIGQDRSALAIHRMGTLEEPEEQVALYVSDQMGPVQFASVIDAVGRLYTDEDNYEALAAIECNRHGISTQDTLQLHHGYSHFYRWEFLDAADPKSRYSTKIGWMTTVRTRPMLLDKLYSALTTRDPVTHLTDLLIHSPLLRVELADFQTEGALWEAEAARGAHDDCVMATAIAHYVSWRLQGGEQEPLSERRARRHAEQEARQLAGQPLQMKRDWRNTSCTAEEANAHVDDDGDESLYDEGRGTPLFLP